MSLLKSLNKSGSGRAPREFPFSEADFDFIKQYMLEQTGICLADRKFSMVYGRLARRLRRHDLYTFSDYLKLIESDEQEKVAFVNALTTNKTQFFREKHHFDYIARELAPQWLTRCHQHVRVWSAGCSTGEEAYSIAVVLSSLLGDKVDFKITATDLDTQVLETAKEGIYDIDAARNIPIQWLKKGFNRGTGSKSELMRVKPELKENITFEQLNLMSEWPHKHKMDVIFFRNVMIYFNRSIQQQLLKRLCGQLRPGGILFIGHSESMGEMAEHFENLGQTAYRKR
ncbi:CheR family methyltransferase [Veronia pacifica]|uniref:CheR family methyltransferase n=1 Tax=Veronia pacifica TaxID=1080227 RepID=UPI00363F5DE5